MGRCCCVPGCKSNYASSSGPDVSTFKFPDPAKEPERHAKWLSALSRDSFTPTKNSVVCMIHFHPQFVVTHDEFKSKEGSIIRVERQRPKLTDDAYPSIFPNQPIYRSTVPAKRRKDPAEREQDMPQVQLKRNFQLQEEKDIIPSFEKLKEGLSKRNESLKSILHPGYIILIKAEDDEFDTVPFIICAKISKELTVKVFSNFAELPGEMFKSCLGPNLKCDRWSKFDSLIQMLPQRDVRPLKEKVICFAEKISDAVVWSEPVADSETERAAKLNFLVEQLKLAVATNIRYSPEMLKWAAAIFYTFPGAYKSMRATQQLTLPHQRYLRKLLCKIGNDGCGIGPTQRAFLIEKFKLLSEEDKVVNLQLNEIYTNSKLVYKAGKVYGIAEHGANTSSDLTAGTIQAFMSSSLQSKNKDVVALFPVRNLDAEILLKLIRAVLKLMVEVGFFVLCAIADNNQVNKKMFDLLCDGVMKTQIPNPYDPSRPLFLLFDQVHLLKNIRNNWLNAPNQTLKIPNCTQVPLFEKPLHTSNPLEFDKTNCDVSDRPVPNEVTFVEAKFSDVKDLYHAEAKSVLKLGSKLTRKAVYPSSVERQNVSLVNAVFSDSTRVALQTLKKDKVAVSDGTIMFIQIFGRWWKISNVKVETKGKRLNDMWCEPVRDCNDMKLKFLRDLLLYGEIWDLASSPNKLSAQTHAAFFHTVKATIELCVYVLTDLGWELVLLGKLQTDDIEGRFGGYRRISGCSYFVTVEQVLEAERKLKLLSILKLKSSKNGEFSLTSFAEECKETAIKLGEKAENVEIFEGAFSEMSSITVTLTDRRVLLCLASYAATKTLQQLRREEMQICRECKETLLSKEPLEIERAKETYEYLSGLDRRGLNRPSDFAFHLCMDAFKLFQSLISQKYEEHFLKLHDQRAAFTTLGVKLCEQSLDDTLFSCETDSCNLTLKKVVKKFMTTLANIFLNNYTKTLNDINMTRQIAIKLSKQEAKKKAEEAKKEAEKAKQKEENASQKAEDANQEVQGPMKASESKSKYSKAKVKDVNARKIAKLSSKGSL